MRHTRRFRGPRRFLLLTTLALATSTVLASRVGVSLWLAIASVLLGAFLLYAFFNAPARYRRYGLGHINQAVDHSWGKFGGTYSEEPIDAETSRIGRNEPCPCGSGRKFKRCCGP